MSEFGLGDDGDWYRQALKLNGNPIGAPQWLPGQAQGMVSPMGAQPAQGAPAGDSAPSSGLLRFLFPGARGNPSWGQALNPLSEWNTQRYFANKGQGQTPAPMPQPMAPAPTAPPVQAQPPAPMPTDPNNPMPQVSATNMVAPPRQPLAQAAAPPPTPPPQPGPPPIPPASAAGRVAQAQGQGSPLDQYFKQMMALQRQRMLLGMAGGLMGAPSFGQGMGRAFTNAAETMAPQSDLVSRIAGAQAAGQLISQQPGMTKKDAQAASEAVLFGGPGILEKLLNPTFQDYKGGSGKFGTAAGGRRYDANTGLSTWAHEMGFQTEKGNATPDYNQAAKKLVNGTMYYKMADGKWRDPTEATAEQ